MFVSFAPFDNPTVVCAVILENAGGGGKNAAPIARSMLDAYMLGKYETPADDEEDSIH